MLSVPGPGTPNSARVWDYWLGGKDNYASDRVFGDRVWIGRSRCWRSPR